MSAETKLETDNLLAKAADIDKNMTLDEKRRFQAEVEKVNADLSEKDKVEMRAAMAENKLQKIEDDQTINVGFAFAES